MPLPAPRTRARRAAPPRRRPRPSAWLVGAALLPLLHTTAPPAPARAPQIIPGVAARETHVAQGDRSAQWARSVLDRIRGADNSFETGRKDLMREAECIDQRFDPAAGDLTPREMTQMCARHLVFAVEWYVEEREWGHFLRTILRS